MQYIHISFPFILLVIVPFHLANILSLFVICYFHKLALCFIFSCDISFHYTLPPILRLISITHYAILVSLPKPIILYFLSFPHLSFLYLPSLFHFSLFSFLIFFSSIPFNGSLYHCHYYQYCYHHHYHYRYYCYHYYITIIIMIVIIIITFFFEDFVFVLFFVPTFDILILTRFQICSFIYSHYYIFLY